MTTMDDLDDHNLPPDYMPGGTDGGRWLEIMRIHGSGTLPGYWTSSAIS
jgi:hypothetical protein